MLASTPNNVDASWKKRKHEEVDVSEVSSGEKKVAVGRPPNKAKIEKSEEMVLYYRPGPEGIASVLGLRLLLTYLDLEISCFPENRCDDVKCLSTPALKCKDTFVSSIPLMLYFLHDKFCLNVRAKGESGISNSTIKVVQENFSPTAKSTKAPQVLELHDTYEMDVSHVDVLNILLELEQIAVEAKYFVGQCKSKEGIDAYVGSSLARKFRSLNANIISNWEKKLKNKTKVVSGKHGQNVVCEITGENKNFFFYGPRISCVDFQIVSLVLQLRQLFGKKIINATLQHRGNLIWIIYRNMRQNSKIRAGFQDIENDMYLISKYISDSSDEDAES